MPTIDNPAFGGRGPGIFIAGWVMAALGIFLTVLRIWGMRQRSGKLRWDFVWIILAILFSVAGHAAFSIALLYGLGNHLNKLTIDDIFGALHFAWTALILGVVGTFWSKLAIITLLMQVLGEQAVKRRIMLMTLAFVLGASYICLIAILLTKCDPPAKLWHLTLPGACPRDGLAIQFARYQGALSAFSDVFLSLFPITIVWNLKTDRRTKIGFCILMASGVVPSVAVIMRTILLETMFHTVDPTWESGPFVIWTALEVWTLIWIGSIPPLRPLILKFLDKIGVQVSTAKSKFSSSSSKSGYGSGKSGTDRSRKSSERMLNTFDSAASGKRADAYLYSVNDLESQTRTMQGDDDEEDYAMNQMSAGRGAVQINNATPRPAPAALAPSRSYTSIHDHAGADAPELVPQMEEEAPPYAMPTYYGPDFRPAGQIRSFSRPHVVEMRQPSR